LTESRAAAVQQAIDKLADGMAEAADVSRELLSSENESARLHACKVMLELARISHH
jgi:hypothetical protein